MGLVRAQTHTLPYPSPLDSKLFWIQSTAVSLDRHPSTARQYRRSKARPCRTLAAAGLAQRHLAFSTRLHHTAVAVLNMSRLNKQNTETASANEQQTDPK